MRTAAIAAICLIVILSAMGRSDPAAQEAYFPFETRNYNGISYVSGGIGFDERRALAKLGVDYSLKLVFAEKGGAYVAMVEVEVSNTRDKTVFKAVSRGPWLYADLPAGDYRITAAWKETAIEKQARVASHGQTEVRFYW